MSAIEVQPPVWAIECDRTNCMRRHVPARNVSDWSERSARRSAELNGWQIRPWSGKGSRRGLDLCPMHASEDVS